MFGRVATFIVALLFASIVGTVPDATASNPPLNIVALGDSFTAGNGTGAANEYGPSDCHRSHKNYLHVFEDFYSESHVVTSTNLACSGATTLDIRNQVSKNPQRVAEADIIFLSIGGNDANFSRVVVSCYLGELFFAHDCKEVIDTAWLQADQIIEKVGQQLDYLASISKKTAKIVLVGYPYLLANCNHTIGLRNEITGQIASYNLSFELRNLQSYVDGQTKTMVQARNSRLARDIKFASLRQLYAGHEVCGAGETWINDGLNLLHSSDYFHPTVQGYRATAGLLRDLNLVTFLSPPPAPNYQPPTSDGPVYPNLPFACGEVVPFASTYNNYSGVNHGLAYDFPMPEGTGVYSPAPGWVEVHLGTEGYGKYVDLHADSGAVYRFAHLAHPSVSNGQRVARGDKIGLVGQTGFTTGPHLHYEKRVDGKQVIINLGEVLHWGNPIDSSGFRTTTHALVSGNCQVSATQPVLDDIMTLSYDNFAWGRSDGHDRNGWGAARENVPTPTSVDSCDFDGDGWDEYIVYLDQKDKLMILDPIPSQPGKFEWRKLSDLFTANRIVCGDWNNDGLDDVMMHNNKNVIYFGRSNGRVISEWLVARLGGGSEPTAWDMCDVNGDGRDDLITYHAGTARFLVGYRASGATMNRLEVLPGVSGSRGFTCGNFTADKGDEMVYWDAGQNGRYIIVEFGNSYLVKRSQVMQPTSRTAPYNYEMVAADVDGDGYDEFLVNIRRNSGEHIIKVGDMTGPSSYSWYDYKNGMQASFLAAGEFVK